MNNTFEATVAFMQLFLLALWEGLGALYFGWPPLTILLCWIVGVFTLNIGTASVLSMYIKLTRPGVQIETPVNLTEEDFDPRVREEG
jgi:phage shock protein PspC (stress-responsive transcriptional regulator)